jgi:uncharacterized protein (TIRG00374 family)
LAAFLSERLSDLLAIVALALFGLTVYPAAQPMVAVGAAAILAALIVLSNERLLERFQGAIPAESRIANPLRQLLQILLQARRCHAPMLLAGATALSLVAWAAEAWAFSLILHWMGLHIPLAFAVFVYAISTLTGALSFLPGGLGGAEAVMVVLLISAGVADGEAIAATILIRGATLWFAVAIGCMSIVRQPLSRPSLRACRGD